MHLILFDIDGTLVNVHGSGRRALERAFHDVFDTDPAGVAEAGRVYYAGSSDIRIVLDLGRALGLAEDAVRDRNEAITARYLHHLERTIDETPQRRACPGVTELLPRLETHPHIHLALMTGNIEAGARLKLEPFGLNRHFAYGGFGEDGPDRADIVARAVSRAEAATGKRFPPERVIVVGDTVHDVRSALAHGMAAAAVGTGWEDLPVLENAGATAVFPDLTPAHGFEEWVAGRWSLA